MRRRSRPQTTENGEERRQKPPPPASDPGGRRGSPTHRSIAGGRRYCYRAVRAASSDRTSLERVRVKPAPTDSGALNRKRVVPAMRGTPLYDEPPQIGYRALPGAPLSEWHPVRAGQPWRSEPCPTQPRAREASRHGRAAQRSGQKSRQTFPRTGGARDSDERRLFLPHSFHPGQHTDGGRTPGPARR